MRGLRALRLAAAGGDVPHRLHHALAYGDVLVPPVDGNVLLTAVEEELVAYLQRRGAIGAQDDVLVVQGLHGNAWHMLHGR